MTLSTDVYILDQVDPWEVFRFCQGLLAKYDEQHRAPEMQKVRHEQDGKWRPLADGEIADPALRSFMDREGKTRVYAPIEGSAWSLDNEPGQDLPAWLMSTYRPDRALRTVEEAAAHDEDCNLPGNKHYDEDEPLCDPANHYDRACWMSLDFDTTYGYWDARGWGCSALHSALVFELGSWLNDKGIRWEWRNEFTGDVFVGLEGLETLGNEGRKAQDWFRNSVLPAIFMEVATNGGGKLHMSGAPVIDIPNLRSGEV